MVETVGLAETVVAVVLFNPVAGNQVYVLAPPTISDVDEPVQIEALLLDVNVGEAFTVTDTVLVLVQPAADVPVIV